MSIKGSICRLFLQVNLYPEETNPLSEVKTMLTADLPRTDPVPAVSLTEGELHFYQREGYLQIPGLLPSSSAREL